MAMPDATVTKSTNPAAWPKGLTRVPRATLRKVEMRTKSVRYRTIGTAVGFVAGFAGGLAAAVGIGGVFLTTGTKARPRRR
jgi:hypothetical protein